MGSGAGAEGVGVDEADEATASGCSVPTGAGGCAVATIGSGEAAGGAVWPHEAPTRATTQPRGQYHRICR